MSTSVRSPRGVGIGREAEAATAYATGALLLLDEAAVHLFVANAAIIALSVALAVEPRP